MSCCVFVMVRERQGVMFVVLCHSWLNWFAMLLGLG